MSSKLAEEVGKTSLLSSMKTKAKDTVTCVTSKVSDSELAKEIKDLALNTEITLCEPFD
jgi:thymidylate kinase